MQTVRYVRWRDGHVWLGYLEQCPDHMTQGETLEELEENPKHQHKHLKEGRLG